VSAHLLALAAALEALQLDDPSRTEAARGLAAQLRRIAPPLAGVKVPAVELLAMATRLTKAVQAAKDAQATAKERAADLRKACAAR
jgi:hypothetical protein